MTDPNSTKWNIFSNPDKDGEITTEPIPEELTEVVENKNPECDPKCGCCEYEEELKMWFWQRWYKQRQDHLINDLIRRADKLNVDPFRLMEHEEFESNGVVIRALGWSVTSIAVLNVIGLTVELSKIIRR